MVKIVGDDGCPITSLCNTMRHTKAFKHVTYQWIDVAKEFDVGDDAENISDCIEYKGYSLYEAYHALFQTWRDQKGEKATLDCLLENLDKHKLFDATDKIRKRFGCSPRTVQNRRTVKENIEPNLAEKCLISSLEAEIVSSDENILYKSYSCEHSDIITYFEKTSSTRRSFGSSGSETRKQFIHQNRNCTAICT